MVNNKKSKIDPRPIKDILAELQKENINSGKEITQAILVKLLQAKGQTLISLSNPERPTSPNREGTLTFSTESGLEFTTKVRTYIRSVNGCPQEVIDIADSAIFDKATGLWLDDPQLSKTEVARQLSISMKTLARVMGYAKGQVKKIAVPQTFHLIAPTREHMEKIRDCATFHKKACACFACGLTSWFNYTIEMIGNLDHVDGNRKNNSLANIRVLCPNCDKQTKTRYSDNLIDLPGSKPIEKINLFESEVELLKSRNARERLMAQGTLPRTFEALNKIPLVVIQANSASGYKSKVIADRLIGEGILEPLCNKCQIKSWREINIRLFLQCHHIDGNVSNNQTNNLELLCANCHRIEHFYPLLTGPSRLPTKIGNLIREPLISINIEAIPNKICIRPNPEYDPESPFVKKIGELLRNRTGKDNMKLLAESNGYDKTTFRRIGLAVFADIYPTPRPVKKNL